MYTKENVDQIAAVWAKEENVKRFNYTAIYALSE